MTQCLPACPTAARVPGSRRYLASSSSIPRSGNVVDRLGELAVTIRNPAGVMARQPEVDPVPDVRELRMMVLLFGLKRDPRQEREGRAEVLEAKGSRQRRSAWRGGPALRCLHLSSFLSYRTHRLL